MSTYNNNYFLNTIQQQDISMVYVTSYRTAEIQHTRYRGNLIQNNNSPKILFIQVHKHLKVNIAIQFITETK